MYRFLIYDPPKLPFVKKSYLWVYKWQITLWYPRQIFSNTRKFCFFILLIYITDNKWKIGLYNQSQNFFLHSNITHRPEVRLHTRPFSCPCKSDSGFWESDMHYLMVLSGCLYVGSRWSQVPRMGGGYFRPKPLQLFEEQTCAYNLILNRQKLIFSYFTCDYL